MVNQIKGICRDLNIDYSEFQIILEEECRGLNGRRRTVEGKHIIYVYINGREEREVIETIAHELRHVWQRKCGHNPHGKHNTYRQSYNENVFEIDARRYASNFVNKTRYKKNKDGMYFTNMELLNFGCSIFLAKMKNIV